MVDIEKISIEKALRKVKPSTSAGPDSIPGKFVQECRTSLLDPLHKIFNVSLTKLEVPETWKVANVMVIHKKGPHLGLGK